MRASLWFQLDIRNCPIMTPLPMICAETEKIDQKSATEVLTRWPFLSVKYASMDLHTSEGRPGRTDFPPLLPLSLR